MDLRALGLAADRRARADVTRHDRTGETQQVGTARRVVEQGDRTRNDALVRAVIVVVEGLEAAPVSVVDADDAPDVAVVGHDRIGVMSVPGGGRIACTGRRVECRRGAGDVASGAAVVARDRASRAAEDQVRRILARG